MSTFARRAAATSAAILALAIVVLLVLRAVGAPIALGPQPTATATPSSTPPSASPTATATPEPATDDALAQIERQVQDLRGLPAPEIGPPDVITRAQLADEIAAMVDAGWTPNELRRANLTLQAMGLLTADQDLAALTEQLLAGEVIGFYEYMQQRMVVVSDVGLDPVARVTYAHEYTHALQDAAFGAGSHLDGLTDDDAAGAYQALLEGDASLLMFQWAFGHLAPDEIGQIGTTPVPDTTGIPAWMLEQLQWPYLAGINFLSSVSGMTFLPDGGGSWGPIDDVYADPPASTEQVLHPEKYLAGEAPIEVEAPSVAAILGEGWVDLEPNTLGEAMLAIWLRELGATAPPPDVAAAGWGGDRMTVAAGPDGEWAMAWRIAWDADAEAREFTDAYPGNRFVDRFSGEVLRTAPTETVVFHASSAELLALLAASFGS